MSTHGVTTTKLTHRSPTVPGERHLGAMTDCYKCKAYIRHLDERIQASRRRLGMDVTRRHDRRAALGMRRRALQAVANGVAIAAVLALLFWVAAAWWWFS